MNAMICSCVCLTFDLHLHASHIRRKIFKKFHIFGHLKNWDVTVHPLIEISSPRSRAVSPKGWQIGLPKVDGFHYMFNMY
jgi:hypothetical protein